MVDRHQDRKAWVGVAVLLVLALGGFFWRPLLTGEVFYLGDIAYFYFPAFVYIARSFQSGSIPLWCPELEGGMPFIGLWETSVLYPVDLLFRFLGDPWVGFNASFLFHYLLAALGMLLYGRALGFAPLAATASALVYALNGFMVMHLAHVNMVAAAAWMPWIFLAVERLWERRRAGTLALAGVLVAMQLLGGHPDVTLMSAFAVGLYALMHPTHGLLSQRRMRPWLFPALSLVGVFGLGVALAAAQMLPTLTLAREAWTRAQESLIVQRGASLLPENYWHFFLPDLMGRPAEDTYFGPGGYGEWCGYAGGLTLILALVGLVARHRMTAFWVSCCGLGLLLALGPRSDLFSLLREVPPFGTMRIPSRWVFLLDFGLALLAGAGLHALMERSASREARRRLQWVAAASLLASLALGVLIGARLAPNGEWMQQAHRRMARAHRGHAYDAPHWEMVYDRRLYGQAIVLGLLLVCGNGLIWSRLRFSGALPWAAPLGVAALYLDLYYFGFGHNPMFPGRDVMAVPHTAQRMRQEAAGRGTPRLARAYSDLFQVTVGGHHAFWPGTEAEERRKMLGMLPGNANLLVGLPAFEQNVSALRLRSWRHLRAAVYVRGGTARRMLHIEHRLWRWHNVGYALSWPPLSLPGLAPLTHEPPYLYRVCDNEGRAFFRSQAVAFGEDRLVFDRLVTAPEVLAHTVLLSPRESGGWRRTRRRTRERTHGRHYGGREGSRAHRDWRQRDRDAAPETPAPVSRGPVGSVTVLREQPHALDLAVTAPCAGHVVLTDTFYPGWKARLDGRPVPIRRANGVHRTVATPPEKHRISFAYEPSAPRLGFFLTLLALSGIAVTWVASWTDGRRRTHRDDGAP